MSSISEAFTELFFGSGSWLGLLLLLAIIITLSIKTRYAGVLMLPVSIFLAIDYITNELLWYSLIMFFTSIFVIINIFRSR